MTTPMPGPHGRPAQVAPSAPAVSRPYRGPLRWFAHGGWYLFVVVLSAGTLSFVPFLHAAIRTRKPLAWLWTALYTAAVITLFNLTGTVNVGGLALGLMIIAVVHSVVLRQQVWPPRADTQPAPAELHHAGPPADPAVAAVLAGRARRDEARRLAATDPLMARELGIGRPDLPRTYDDGGLVDLNSAPAATIANTCGIELAIATLIVNTRTAGITFTSVDDVFTLTEIPFPLWDRIRDRAVLITG
ncbi:ComEA family DNA-binding protein [Pseudonocardia sp. CA-142604]|uniref:ComEA family DNA-binding protein n=1 Tax=Pseudonocardia sp. CA-142604 TaxID=3240024 RepID=UPI003D8A5E54